MTALQIEYQRAQEQARANRENERIKQQEADTKQFEANTKEVLAELEKLKAPASITELISKAKLNDASATKAIEELKEIEAKVAELHSQAGLNTVRKWREYGNLYNDAFNLLHRLTGATPIGDSSDTLKDWIGNLIGGVGKGLGALIA